MAISIDTVYQKVLALANKEQRGYITPQEFNLLANQAQLLIFEQYFYDIEQATLAPGNDTEYSDRINILNEKIAPFQQTSSPLSYNAFYGQFALPTHHRIGTVTYNPGSFDYPVEVEEIRENELIYINSSPISRPTLNRPVYVQKSEEMIEVFPSTVETGAIYTTYILKPAIAVWGYTVVNNQALYDSTTTTNFELHPSEENELIYKILELAGIVLNKPGLSQTAEKEDQEITAKKQ